MNNSIRAPAFFFVGLMFLIAALLQISGREGFEFFVVLVLALCGGFFMGYGLSIFTRRSNESTSEEPAGQRDQSDSNRAAGCLILIAVDLLLWAGIILLGYFVLNALGILG